MLLRHTAGWPCIHVSAVMGCCPALDSLFTQRWYKPTAKGQHDYWHVIMLARVAGRAAIAAS